jgi:hypothetical protein
MRRQSNVLKLPALAAAAAALLLGSTALAAVTAAQPVKVVEFTQQAGYNQLLVQLNDGTNYYANPGQAAPGCGINAATLETTKVWLSLVQSSLLSGKNAKIYYTACIGYNWITGIDLGP